jgi:hypothetical protein
MNWINESNFTDTNNLPSLSFSLSEKGKKFYIPLSSLYNPITKKFLIYQTNDIYYYYFGEGILSQYPKIEFGSFVFHSLYMILDITEYKIGVLQKENVNNDNTLCNSKAICKGSQRYYSPMNVCRNPYCAIYQTVDSNTKNCVLVNYFF